MLPVSFLSHPPHVGCNLAEGFRCLHGVILAPAQVAQTDHADQPSSFHHRQSADLLLCHGGSCLRQAGIRCNSGHTSTHDLRHRCLLRRTVQRHAPQYQIPVGHNAAEAAVSGLHRQRAHIVTSHDSCRNCSRFLRRHGNDMTIHAISDFHYTHPFWSFSTV